MGKLIVRYFATSALALTAIVFFTIAWEQPAYAYLDPGAGSLLLQVLMGGVAGAAVVVKVYWKSLIAKFSRNSETTGVDQGDDVI